MEKQSILIVEDDAAIRESLSEALLMRGFNTSLAANGREALNHLQVASPKPELIILDLMMPVMTGWEFLDELYREASASRIPVIIVSAVEAKDIKHPVSDVIAKPIELGRFFAAINKILGSGLAKEGTPPQEGFVLATSERVLLKKLGARITKKLQEKGKSSDWLASEASVARSTLREILSGRSNPRILTLHSLAKALGYEHVSELLKDL
ncbi:response regulator [Bdellovibrionota bacterium FG-2]